MSEFVQETSMRDSVQTFAQVKSGYPLHIYEISSIKDINCVWQEKPDLNPY